MTRSPSSPKDITMDTETALPTPTYEEVVTGYRRMAESTWNRKRADAAAHLDDPAYLASSHLASLIEAKTELELYTHGQDKGADALARRISHYLSGPAGRSTSTFTNGVDQAQADAARRVLRVVAQFLDPAAVLTYLT